MAGSCASAEVGEGHCPIWTSCHLNPYDLARRTGAKQLLCRGAPLDKYSTFNNKLCKPNAKQFLASKLDFAFFKKREKVQVISVLSGEEKQKPKTKSHLVTCYPNQSQLQFLSRVGVTRRPHLMSGTAPVQT